MLLAHAEARWVRAQVEVIIPIHEIENEKHDTQGDYCVVGVDDKKSVDDWGEDVKKEVHNYELPHKFSHFIQFWSLLGEGQGECHPDRRQKYQTEKQDR